MSIAPEQNWQNRLRRTAKAALKEAIRRGFAGCTACGNGEVDAAVLLIEAGPMDIVWNRGDVTTRVPYAAFSCKKCGCTATYSVITLLGADRVDWLLNDVASAEDDSST